jgi:hypothetical protein
LKSKKSSKIQCNKEKGDKVPHNLDLVNPPIIDLQCNLVDIFNDEYLYPALTMDLYALPAESVSTYQASVHQIPSPSHIVGSEKMEQNKLLLKKKFQYPRVDPEESKFVDERSDHEKMASILRISSQILSKDELTVWISSPSVI